MYADTRYPHISVFYGEETMIASKSLIAKKIFLQPPIFTRGICFKYLVVNLSHVNGDTVSFSIEKIPPKRKMFVSTIPVVIMLI